MIGLKEAREEIERRGAQKIAKRRSLRKTLLSVCVPVLAVAIALSVIIPAKKAADLKEKYNYVASEGSDLMAGITARSVTPLEDLDPVSSAMTDFGLRLFKKVWEKEEGKNVLVSPLSVITALGMTVNGAQGQTLTQMEETLGASAAELNSMLQSYTASLPQNEKCRLDLANSIWIKDDPSFKVSADFLQTNADYYGADAYKEAFDEKTRDAINSWVSARTGGMIDHLVDDLEPELVMLLINAMSFNAEWDKKYEPEDIIPGARFMVSADEIKDITLMNSTESVYLHTDGAEGFMKYYKGKDYAFAALLPNMDSSLSELISSLSTQELLSILKGEDGYTIHADMLKFESDYDTELLDALSALGIQDLFDPAAADLSALGRMDQGNIFIGSVIHKTHITVDENGTKAAAVTGIKAYGTAYDPKVKFISLNRPFLYMIVDCKTNTPVFIGAVTDPS